MRRSPLAVIYLTVFIDLLGFSIILPLLPFYAEHFGATGVWVGALLTAYSAVQFVSAPVLGRVSDRVGRRPILLLSLAGSAASLTLTGFAHSLALLLLGRALAGLFGGSISTAQAYIADVTRPEERGRYMGMLGASVGLGFVFGPAVGAGFSGLGFGAAAFFAAALAAANFSFACFKLPESRTTDRIASARTLPSRGRLAGALRQPALTRVLSAIFLTTCAFVGVEATFALFSQKQWGLGARGFGLVFTYLGLVVVVVQGGLMRRLHGRYPERVLAAAGAGLMAATLLLLTLTPNVGVGLVVLAGLALGQGLVSPTLPTLLSRQSGADEQGSTLGLGQSCAAAARAVGPLLAGWLYDGSRALPYVAGAVMALGALGLLSAAPAHSRQSPGGQPLPASLDPEGG